uniref:ATP-dependent RNA helicase n=1 Tax=Odontella aurita TaxID=265563 RepID=A0A7S4JCQ7_9STRA|mmetsp:Transcript_43868/g.133591  ORF Transcript_43868/g.133591 Transcript_43868/m.133591 type:complete len:736 (+) Transcript_43868:203-2410(+)|eukprot:CAMPEP_0113592054 /NCGR_PEP_ID=MMETSP0015_2-20120614/37624_1 /TAXON_ID=2838 /ORGANISM="Odontella" /LENGTH=735 /DNA_ID=CAMNT_0000498529 /DNA_START=92 /DNA_END=2299 /DNA_ORIENTATION=+ /assembly_acc=CAM_ASM_000160
MVVSSLAHLFPAFLALSVYSGDRMIAGVFAFSGQVCHQEYTSRYSFLSSPDTGSSGYKHRHHRPLFASSSSGQRTSGGGATPKRSSREEELSGLASSLNIDVPKVKELLAKQRRKSGISPEKARRIDWLLNGRGLPKEDKVKEDQRVAKVATKAAASNSPEKNSKPAAQERGRSTRARPRRPAAVAKQEEDRQAQVKKRHDAALKDPSLLSNVDFSSRVDIHHSSKRALTEIMGFTSMTEIQARTYAAALSGKDVLGRARTGTGKTLAFLLPAIEGVLRSREYQPGLNIGVLVISNTRELAIQIGDEAEKLLTFHPDMSVQVVYGGTKKSRDETQLRRRMPTILVATPGRLQDLLTTTRIGARKFSEIMSTTPVLVLDETDRLLDMGFRREIDKILTFLPRSNKRQTLLFSATIPDEMRSIMAKTMKEDFIEVDCIGDGAETTHTNVRVKQSHVIIPTLDRYLTSVVDVVQEAAKDDEGRNKIVVFFPTARMVSYFADLFNEVAGTPVMELHSKKTQSYRNRVSKTFRSAANGILFTSDVSARGVDYPDVTHVIQVGMPESREQYIHRLGRTGRAGKAGKGWLVLGPFESQFLGELKSIDVQKDMRLADLVNGPPSTEAEDILDKTVGRVRAGDKKLTQSGERAYQAFLGYYLSQMKRMKMRKKDDLVRIANEISSLMGFHEAPSMTKRMVGKMGLKGVAGLVIREPSDEHHGHHEHSNGRRAGNNMKRQRRRRD